MKAWLSPWICPKETISELLFFMQPGSPTAFSSVKSLDILLINVLFDSMPPIPTDRTFKFSSQKDSLL